MARPMAGERPVGSSLVVMKGVAVALLVAAAAFAPSTARAEAPVTAATTDRAADAGAAPVAPDVAVELRATEPVPDAATLVPKAATTPDGPDPSDDPSRTLPPTDTELPAVDGRH